MNYIEETFQAQKDVMSLNSYIFKKIEKFRGNILEIGSCPFVVTKKLKDKGLDVTGVDIQYDSEILNVVKCNIEREELPFQSESFSIILLMDVFEHLWEDPLFSLESIKRVLKKDGVVIISTPNFFRIKNIFSLIMYGAPVGNVIVALKSLRKEYGFYNHLKEYTMKEIEHILDIQGFEIIEKKYILGGEKNNIFAYMAVKCIPFLRQSMVFCCKKK